MSLRNKILLAAVTILIFSGFIRKDTDIYFEINKSIDIFGRVYKEVTLNYVDEINPEEFMLAGINGMLESLDPYTNFIDGSDQKDIDIITKGKYGGIGASVGLRNDDITVVDLIEGYSAQRQGIRIGDVITKINETEVNKDNYESLSDFLKGDPGTTVKIVIKRDGTADELVFNLVREEIEVKNISYFGFYPENSGTAYIKLSGFSRTAGDEVKNAIIALKNKREIKNIVLDLRGNPGGLLDAAIDVSEKFLQKGQLIVSVKGRDSTSTKKFFAEEEPIAGNLNVAVLVDEGSASASEIVAGALQDHDRAVVVGANSFGKGLVQTVIPLSYNTSLKITTGKYYTPSGRSIQKIDYSDKNKVFQNGTAVIKSIFKTDNKRGVVSAGGIVPDSSVGYDIKSQLLRKFYADGIFFQFATTYYNNNSTKNFQEMNGDFLLSEFKKFLKEKNFEFISTAEKLIDQLKKAAVDENLDQSMIVYLDNAKSQFDHNHSNEIEKYKAEVISAIKEELASRSGGRQARINESLKTDKQFHVAEKIVNANNLYANILKSGKKLN